MTAYKLVKDLLNEALDIEGIRGGSTYTLRGTSAFNFSKDTFYDEIRCLNVADSEKEKLVLAFGTSLDNRNVISIIVKEEIKRKKKKNKILFVERTFSVQEFKTILKSIVLAKDYVHKEMMFRFILDSFGIFKLPKKEYTDVFNS